MPIYEFNCHDCGEPSTIFFRSFSSVKEKPNCPHCDGTALSRKMSRPGLLKVKGGAGSGEMRAMDGRKAVENMSRQYDNMKIDPGDGFAEVAKQAAAGADPQTLQQAVKEAKKKSQKES